MNTIILSIDAGYSLRELAAANPALLASLELLDISLEDERILQSREQFLREIKPAIQQCNLLLVIDGSETFYAKEIVARGLGRPLQQDPQATLAIKRYLAKYGREASAGHLEYAKLPQGAVVLPNENSMEQGFVMFYPSLCVAVLPANRKSLEPMFSESLFPVLLGSLHPSGYTCRIPLREDQVEAAQQYALLHSFREPGFSAAVFRPTHSAGKQEPFLQVASLQPTQEQSRSQCQAFLQGLAAETGPLPQPQGPDGALEPSPEPTSRRKARPHRSPKGKRDPYEEYEFDDMAGAEAATSGKAGGWGRKLILLLLGVVFAVCLGYLAWWFWGSYQNRTGYQELRQLYDQDSDTLPEGYPQGYDPQFVPLWQRNPDVVGWLSLEGTDLDYPVVQAQDNTKYYRTNFDGQPSEHAVPFADYRVDLAEPSTNTILYGHNIKADGQMFNILQGYKELSFYQQHPTIRFDSVYQPGEYKVFAAFYANTRPEHGEIFPYHDFIDGRDSSEVQQYIDDVLLRSILDTGVEVLPSDQLLTLSTCTYEFEDARFVVVARRVREGESPQVAVEQAQMATQPLYPDVWYDLFGGSKPESVPQEEAPPPDTPEGLPSGGESLGGDATQGNGTTQGGDATQGSIGAQDSVALGEDSGEGSGQADDAAQDKPSQGNPNQTQTSTGGDGGDSAGQTQGSVPAGSGAQSTVPQPTPTPEDEEDEGKKKLPASSTTVLEDGAVHVTQLESDDSKLYQDTDGSQQPEGGQWVETEEETDPNANGAGTPEGESTQSQPEAPPQTKPEDKPQEQPQAKPEDKPQEQPQSQPEDKPQEQPQAKPERPAEPEEEPEEQPPASSLPQLSVKVDGKTTRGDAFEIVAAMVEAEMGPTFQDEALKAQAVAAYTYVLHNNSQGVSPWVATRTPVSSAVQRAVQAVLGEAVLYQGSYANTTFCASSAGHTNDSASVWGGYLPYLVSVPSPGDETLRAFGATKSFSADEVADLIADYCNVDPWDTDPEEWFTNPSYINGRYVDKIDVCGQKVSGRNVREGILKSKINSAAFEVAYDSGSDSFTFTTYGLGHGVGMSQQGADYYAMQGWSYQEILAHYYPGTTLR